MTTPQDQPLHPAPRTLVLNYVTRDVTPSRARNICFCVLLSVGAIAASALFLLVAYLLYNAIDNYLLTAISTGDWASVWYAYGEEIIVIALTAIAFFVAVSYVPLAFSVRRGKRWAALLAIVAMIPLFLFIMYIAAALIGGGVFFALDAREPAYWQLALTIPLGLLATFVSALVFDLFAYLRWISRAPLTEMPRREFL